MIELKILLSALIGTSLMTLGNYTLSRLSNKDFFEPQLLNRLLYRMDIIENRNLNHIAGWTIHYSLGFTLAAIFWIILELYIGIAAAAIFVVLGLLSGLMACILWEGILILHPHPPRIKLREVYLQLLFAHTLFGLGCWIASVMLR